MVSSWPEDVRPEQVRAKAEEVLAGQRALMPVVDRLRTYLVREGRRNHFGHDVALEWGRPRKET